MICSMTSIKTRHMRSSCLPKIPQSHINNFIRSIHQNVNRQFLNLLSSWWSLSSGSPIQLCCPISSRGPYAPSIRHSLHPDPFPDLHSSNSTRTAEQWLNRCLHTGLTGIMATTVVPKASSTPGNTEPRIGSTTTIRAFTSATRAAATAERSSIN